MRIIAETVAVHARYHLTVMLPLPKSQQRKASLRGDERFKILAKQVDRRIRLGRPLMQDTINRLSAANLNHSELEIAKDAPGCPGLERAIEEVAPERERDIQDQLNAATGEGGSHWPAPHLAEARPRSSISIVAVMPAVSTTPGGTSSIWMRTGTRCAKRTQVKMGLTVATP
jgi:hypothetical protein